MADIQVSALPLLHNILSSIVDRKKFPKAAWSVPQYQETSCQENNRWS
jgi:hypothetical protein